MSENENAVAEWFEGFDGQVLLEDDHLWIVREGLTDKVGFEFATAPRAAVAGTVFHPATDSTLGALAVRIAGGRRRRQTSGIPT